MKSQKHTDRPGRFGLTDIRAIDGDAIEATIQLPFGALIRKRIRLRGWWAPEIGGDNDAAAKLCKEKLHTFLQQGGFSLNCPFPRTDKYGRVLGILEWNGYPLRPESVLGLWQMTEEAHKAALDKQRAQGRLSALRADGSIDGPSDKGAGWDDQRPHDAETP